MAGKRLVALLLAMGMVVTATAGCGKTAENGSDNKDANTDTTATNDQSSDNGEDDEEMTDITVALMSLGPIDTANSEAVQDAINEITESQINVHVDLQWYDAATYASTVPMMIQGGDQLDLMMYTPVPGSSFASFLGAGQLMNLTDLLDEYGQDVVSTQGDFITGASLNGKIYGIGNYGDKVSREVITIRKDILEEVGRLEDAKNATTWTEMEDIMKDVVAAGHPGFVNVSDGTVLNPNGYCNGPDSFAENRSTDILGDGYALISTDETTDKVECKYFTDDYRQAIERVSRWYNEGLVYKDAATSQEYGDTLLKSENGIGMVHQVESGGLKSTETITGHEFMEIKICDSEVATGTCTKFGFCIPVVAKYPEAAMRFLNLLYSSEDVVNTLTWGVEGRDWVATDDGYATFPDGVTSETVKYHTADFLYGNQFLAKAWEGAALTREEQKELNKDVVISKYFGFQIDNTNLENIVTACFNVEKQYAVMLEAGAAGDDWEKTLDEFQAALKKAGIDDLIAAYQEQLDAWLAAQ